MKSTRAAWTIVLVIAIVPTWTDASDPGKAEDADAPGARPAAVDSSFDAEIAPILAERCLDCHSGPEPKGGLDLSRRRTALAGGETGRAITPGSAESSLLWQRARSGEMPPKERLPDRELEALARWISSGARWGTDPIDPFRFTTDRRAGYDWWSLQPIRDPVVPFRNDGRDDPGAGSTNHPVDAFVRRRLDAEGITPSAPASPRALLRRLSFGLTGLPPSPSELEAFVAESSDAAYLASVDRLLSSPHYGERWARHWLDVVRFGESHGFEYDQPRNNAWPYRNWVIDAFNRDLPYNEFVRLQIAGDVLTGGSEDGVAATGFLVAGPHNTTLPSSDKMRRSMAQDELEDLVGVVGQSFLGLTVNCGRCHDHKFDPISQRDYYELASALAGVRHGEREVRGPAFERRQARIAAIDREVAELRRRVSEIDVPARRAILAERGESARAIDAGPAPIAQWDFARGLRDQVGELHGTAERGARLEDGGLVVDGRGYVVTPPIAKGIGEKTLEAWVRLADLGQRGGGVISIQTPGGDEFDAIVYGEREAGQWMAGSDGFRRTKSFGGPEETEAVDRPVHVAIVYAADGTVSGFRDGKPYGSAYRSVGLKRFPAKTSVVLFGLRHADPGGNRLLRGTILGARLFDRALSPDEVAASARSGGFFIAEEEIIARLDVAIRARRGELAKTIASLEAERDGLAGERPQKMYTNSPAGNPGATHILVRGDVTRPGEVVAPRGLSALRSLDPDFGLDPAAPDAARRVKLADWLAHSDSPLLARVMVNRVWQYHFGRGLVPTANDFGFSGGHPSHPDLLDWLAREFIRSGWSLKHLHRTILSSATYRQSSRWRADAIAVDAGNRLLWRFHPRRLEAEAIRDAMLVAAGVLRAEIGGRGYRDVRHYPHKGSNFYAPLDETGEEFNRRTIYRFVARGGRNPFLDTFDCPDPSTTTPTRTSTTTPLQALSLLNNPFVLRAARLLGARLEAECGDAVERQIERAFVLVYGRPPSAGEVRFTSAFVKEHGIELFCRALLNSSEFLYLP